MNLIAAVDKNWAIGKNNELLVSIPNDMKMFRQMTTGKVVVMGRKTLESFPNGLPLKNRVNIVLTKNQNYQVKGAIIVHSVEEVLEELKRKGYEIPEEALKAGMKKTVWLGRFSAIARDPLFIVDGAHNRDAARVFRDSV